MADHDETRAPGMLPRINDDDDVEGHGHGTPRAAGGDDVEGHGHGNPRAAGEDDVEGHGHGAPRAADDEDDVEGHFGYMKGPSSRGE